MPAPSIEWLHAQLFSTLEGDFVSWRGCLKSAHFSSHLSWRFVLPLFTLKLPLFQFLHSIYDPCVYSLRECTAASLTLSQPIRHGLNTQEAITFTKIFFVCVNKRPSLSFFRMFYEFSKNTVFWSCRERVNWELSTESGIVETFHDWFHGGGCRFWCCYYGLG